MTKNRLSRRALLTLSLMATVLATGLAAQTAPPRAIPAKPATYFPAAGTWQHKAPAEVGMDAAKLPYPCHVHS